jgi:hypothetical protein
MRHAVQWPGNAEVVQSVCGVGNTLRAMHAPATRCRLPRGTAVSSCNIPDLQALHVALCLHQNSWYKLLCAYGILWGRRLQAHLHDRTRR